MTEPLQSIDHTGLLALLLEQYKYRTDGAASKLSGMISMVAAELNLTETAIQEMLTAFDISTAVGAQLDLLGSIFGAPRSGLGDVAYRAAILAAATHSVSGTPEQIIGFIRSVVGGAAPIRLQVAEPATIYVYADTGTLSGITVAQIEQVAPAGVRVILPDFRVTDDGVVRETDDHQTRFVGG
jgi:hypothetical protein